MWRHKTSMNCDFSMQPRHSSAAFTPAKKRGRRAVVGTCMQRRHSLPALSTACTAPRPCMRRPHAQLLAELLHEGDERDEGSGSGEGQHAHLAPAAPCGFASSSTTRSPRGGTSPCLPPLAPPRPHPPDDAGHQVRQVTKPATKQVTKQGDQAMPSSAPCARSAISRHRARQTSLSPQTSLPAGKPNPPRHPLQRRHRLSTWSRPAS